MTPFEINTVVAVASSAATIAVCRLVYGLLRARDRAAFALTVGALNARLTAEQMRREAELAEAGVGNPRLAAAQAEVAEAQEHLAEALEGLLEALRGKRAAGS